MAEVNFIVEEDMRRALRRDRVFLDRSNPLETQNDQQLIENYRFPRNLILEIVEICRGDLERTTSRNHALPVHLQVLLSLW